MTLRQYTDQIIKGCYLDKDDPVSEWADIHKNVIDIKKWLNSLKVKSFHIASENIDLTITPGERRKWAGVSGHNIPSFEVFLSPDWRGTEGTYFANLPSFRSGNYVEGVRITFAKGDAVKIEATYRGRLHKETAFHGSGRSQGWRIFTHRQTIFQDRSFHGRYPFR